MKITAKLAYSQIKIHRSRTLWTLAGIILSTALITTVCSFAASANALLIDLYDGTYDGYKGLFTALLLIPAIILSAVIVSMAVIVISNAFRVSANERRTQFGILKSAGTTKQQITAIVMYESLFLSAMGIPLGIIAGLGITFAGVQVANNLLGELNSLVHLMMNEFTITVHFIIAWQAILAASLTSFFSVLLSAWLPARKAAKIPAIDSIRNVGEIQIETKRVRANPLILKFFGAEGVLAARNMKRSKRNFRASIISLTIGIILFINLGVLQRQVDTILNILYSYSDPDIITVDYSSSYDYMVNETTGKEERVILAPIDSKTAENIRTRLLEYENATVFGIGYDMMSYTANVAKEFISPEMAEAVFSSEKTTSYELPVEIITVDKDNYILLCEQAGVPEGSNILINHYSHNDKGHAVTLTPFQPEMQGLQLIAADNSIQELEIHGILTPENVPDELLFPGSHILRLIIPEGQVRNYSWLVDTTNPDDFIDYANTIMAEIYPEVQDVSYMELGYTTRVFRTQDYMKLMNIPIVLSVVFIYSFVILLVLIGLTSVISTMSTNVQMRSREFAVLQSIGMTQDGLKRILSLESILCSAKALIYGIPLAIIFTYLINMPIRSIFPVPYQFPWFATLCCIVVVFILTWSVMFHASRQLYKRNIIETIRLEK